MIIDWSSFSWLPSDLPMVFFLWPVLGNTTPPPSGAALIQDIQTIGVINQIGNDKFMLNTSTGLV